MDADGDIDRYGFLVAVNGFGIVAARSVRTPATWCDVGKDLNCAGLVVVLTDPVDVVEIPAVLADVKVVSEAAQGRRPIVR